MKRNFSTGAVSALALACSATLVLAVAAQARPNHASPQATAHAVSNCSIVISGRAWQIQAGGTVSGNKYTITASDMPCSGLARTSVLKFINMTNPGPAKTFHGPSGFTCHSFTTPAFSKLLLSGVCMRQPHNHPFFEWGAKAH